MRIFKKKFKILHFDDLDDNYDICDSSWPFFDNFDIFLGFLIIFYIIDNFLHCWQFMIFLKFWYFLAILPILANFDYFDHFWQFWTRTSTKTILETCDIWDTDYNSDNWEPEFMTIFVTWQLIVTLDSIRNSCDVLLHRCWGRGNPPVS